MEKPVIESRIKGFIYLFLFVAGIWLCLTSTLQWPEVLAGLVVAVLVAWLLGESYSRIGLPSFSLRRLLAFVLYLGVLIEEIVRANVDVAYRVLHPRMPIRPGIVTIRTNLKQDAAKLMLANSITLTPGTFTLDILGDRLLIHWINVRTDDAEEATRIIAGRFEKYLQRVFG